MCMCPRPRQRAASSAEVLCGVGSLYAFVFTLTTSDNVGKPISMDYVKHFGPFGLPGTEQGIDPVSVFLLFSISLGLAKVVHCSLPPVTVFLDC